VSSTTVVSQESSIDVVQSRWNGVKNIMPNDQGGFVLAVDLGVVIPELDHDQAQALADAADLVCPYCNATRGNIVVTVPVTDD